MRQRHVVFFIMGAVVGTGCLSFASAQPGKLGSYAGKVTVTVNEATNLSKKSIKGEVTLSFPVTGRSAREIEADLSDPSVVKASMRVTQFETLQTESSPDSGGQINTTTCTLAQPTEVPLMGQGNFSINLPSKDYTFAIALITQKNLPMNCVHSRSGAHKRDEAFSIAIGTHEPGPPPSKGVPFTDPAVLAAKFTMPQGPAMKSNGVGPTEQEWTFRFQP